LFYYGIQTQRDALDLKKFKTLHITDILLVHLFRGILEGSTSYKMATRWSFLYCSNWIITFYN